MSAESVGSARPRWLTAFRQGTREGIEACYRECFDAVDKAVGSVLSGADRDTVVHEVFYKLITRPDARMSFTGKNLSSWLCSVARNQAIDFVRRRQWEARFVALAQQEKEGEASPETSTVARQLVDRFRARLPKKLVPVFQKRFIEARSQRQAARELDVPRTTLVYYEKRIRTIIHRFAAEVDRVTD